MFIEAKKLIGLPVAAMDTQSKVGQIRQILIDPENGRLLGFEVATGGILSPKKILAISDIRDWDPNGLVTESINNLIGPSEVLRIKNILDKKIFLLGMKAKTESGKSLGAVEDLLLDTETECVTKYYLKDLLGQARILSADKVIKIDRRQITFADDVAELPSGAAGAVA